MTDNTSNNGPTGKETPSATETSSKSEETKNTSDNQKLFNDGYGLGIEKGQKELLKQLGVNNVDDLKGILSEHNKRVEADKSTEQKLADLQASLNSMQENYTETKTKLELYVERDRGHAKKLYESLSDEDRKAFDSMDIPLEKAIPLLERFSSNNSTKSKSNIGGSFSPSPGNVNNGRFAEMSPEEMITAYAKGGRDTLKEVLRNLSSE